MEPHLATLTLAFLSHTQTLYSPLFLQTPHKRMWRVWSNPWREACLPILMGPPSVPPQQLCKTRRRMARLSRSSGRTHGTGEVLGKVFKSQKTRVERGVQTQGGYTSAMALLLCKGLSGRERLRLSLQQGLGDRPSHPVFLLDRHILLLRPSFIQLGHSEQRRILEERLVELPCERRPPEPEPGGGP